MRTLTDHIVSGDQAVQLQIDVTDEPGAGGANHEYRVSAAYRTNEVVPLLKLSDPVVSHPDGSVTGVLASVSFQNGPIKEEGVNGVTQEALLAIVIDRLRSFQAGPFASAYNASALLHCEQALESLKRRTLDRLGRGVEGTHQK